MVMFVWTARIRAARTALRLGQRELAAEAEVGRSALVSIEANRNVRPENLFACQHALEKHGVTFWEFDGAYGILFLAGIDDPYSRFFRAARAVLMATQDETAMAANIAPRTIARLETGQAGSRLKMEAYLRTLTALGVDYFEVEGRTGLIVPSNDALREIADRYIVAAAGDEE